jgi:hypothetical protein
LFTDIADALREKHGTTQEFEADNFPNNIRAIRTDGEGGIVPTGTILITTNGTHDVTHYESVRVNVSVSSGTSGDTIEVGSLSELHSWTKNTPPGTITEKTVTNLMLCYGSSVSSFDKVDYADEYEVVNGGISLVNPTKSWALTSSTSTRNAIKGKYIYSHRTGGYYYIPPDADVKFNQSPVVNSVTVDSATLIQYIGENGKFIAFVVSSNPSAYPQDGVKDGYWYVYNGTLE